MSKQDKEEDYILHWQAPKTEKPEFRLYYDEQGNVITYSCEKLEGNYIVIDALTFAEARPDARVIKGKLVRANSSAVVSKLKPNSKEGVVCAAEDVSILVASKSRIKKQKWKLETYEL